MNASRSLVLVLCVMAFSSLTSSAQDKFKFLFHGNCWTTNAAGRLVTRTVSEQTWLQDYIAVNAVTNAKSLILVYHINGDERGDVIEIDNATNGTLVAPVFALFFGDSFGRTSLTDASGTQIKRIEYVYGQQIAESVGAASLSERIFLDRNGNTNKITLQGEMSYEILPDAKHASLQICDGTFFLTKPLTLGGTNAP